jgi:hypothetical protein
MHIPNIMDVTLPARRAIAYRDNGGYELSVELPDGKYKVTRYRISEDKNFAQVDASVASGPKLRLQAPLAAPGIEFIKIERL